MERLSPDAPLVDNRSWRPSGRQLHPKANSPSGGDLYDQIAIRAESSSRNFPGLTSSLGLLSRPPVAQVFEGQVELTKLLAQKRLEIVAHALAAVGDNLVVPLLEPGQKFSHAGQQRGEAVLFPAILFAAFQGIGGQSLGALQVVPAGPTQHYGVPSASRSAPG